VGKKSLRTPRSKVRNALRMLWLRSRERAFALKRDGYTCQVCHRKKTTAKGKEFDVGVHHILGIGNWEKVIDLIFEELLCDPIFLKTACDECHSREELPPPPGVPAKEKARV
jgi:hypothetical protein